MKMERLIGILSILLQRGKVTAPETGVICVAIHTFEWPFVRLALFALMLHWSAFSSRGKKHRIWFGGVHH